MVTGLASGTVPVMMQSIGFAGGPLAKRRIVGVCTVILLVAGLTMLGVVIDVAGVISQPRGAHVR